MKYPEDYRLCWVPGGVAYRENDKWVSATGLDYGRTLEWTPNWWIPVSINDPRK